MRNQQIRELLTLLPTTPETDELQNLFEAMDREQQSSIDQMVQRFLAWQLPETVCADACASIQRYPHRTGTCLLSAVEAKAMIQHVLGSNEKSPEAGATE